VSQGKRLSQFTFDWGEGNGDGRNNFAGASFVLRDKQLKGVTGKKIRAGNGRKERPARSSGSPI